TFDEEARRWRWDLERIRQQRFTDNVVDLMMARLRRLPEATLEVLRLAACLGSSVESSTLARASQLSEEHVHRHLWRALQSGLLVRTGNTYAFLHDRVQQAAYLLTPEAERPALHLHLGRRLLEATEHRPPEEHLFDIVHQLDLGASLLRDAGERRELAELNLRAGRKAKASAAWLSAVSYLAQGMALLEHEPEEAPRALDFALRCERAWCEYLGGRQEEARRRVEALLEEPWLDEAQRAEASCLQVELYVTLGEMPRAIRSGLACLEALGLHLPEHPTAEEVEQAHEELERALAGREVEELLALPLTRRPDIQATMRVLSATLTPALFLDARLVRLLALELTTLGVRHGHSAASVWGYVCLGMSLVSVDVGRYEEGYRFGLLAYELVKKHGLLASAARVGLILGDVIGCWVRPQREGLERVLEAFRQGVEVGDLIYSCYCCNHIVTLLLATGAPLEEVARDLEQRMDFVRRAGDLNILAILESQQRFVLCMQGRTSRFGHFDDASFDEAGFEESVAGSHMQLMVCWYYILKLQARLLAGEVEQALEAAERAEALLAATARDIQLSDYHYFAALARAAACTDAAPEAKRRHLEGLERHERQLAVW
ncbi:MAG TPA: histidine kinase, partial [Myxococcaceae bacterium]|nr:histidine kinase [Myxococcaceae bacterium]